jgi:aryl-alcohol dehydrogenase-like predicted oxidoreductase
MEAVHADRLLDKAYERGIRVIDLAEGYGGGLARPLVADHIRRRPGREWRVWDKVGILAKDFGVTGKPVKPYWDRAEILGKELLRLSEFSRQVAIESVQLHVPVPVFTRELEHSLQKFNSSLEISWGLSNHSPKQLTMSTGILRSLGFRTDLAQVQLSILEQKALSKWLPAAEALSLKTAANRVFGRGLLSRDSNQLSKRLMSSPKVRRKASLWDRELDQLRALCLGNSVSLISCCLSFAFYVAKTNYAVIGFSSDRQIDQVMDSLNQLEVEPTITIGASMVAMHQQILNRPNHFMDRS